MNQSYDTPHAIGNGSHPGPSSGSLDFISAKRVDSEYEEAKRHAKRVRFLKIALPITGVVIILIVLLALLVRQLLLPNFDLDAISMQDGKLVMENPNLNGVDRDKRPFSLSADSAIQDADQPKRVELIAIKAKLPMDDTNFANITAGNGVYDAEAKTLVLTEDVDVVTTDGMQIRLKNADVDIAEGVLQTENPISATSDRADIVSDGLLVTDNGKRLIFEGGVRMTLRPGEPEKVDQ